MQRRTGFVAALALGVGLVGSSALADVQPVHDGGRVMLAQNTPSTASGQPGNDITGTGQSSPTGSSTLIPMPFGVAMINPSTLGSSSILSAPTTVGPVTTPMSSPGVAQATAPPQTPTPGIVGQSPSMAPNPNIINSQNPSTAPNPNIINSQNPSTVPNPNIISTPGASPTTTTPGSPATGPFAPPSAVAPGTTPTGPFAPTTVPGSTPTTTTPTTTTPSTSVAPGATVAPGAAASPGAAAPGAAPGGSSGH